MLFKLDIDEVKLFESNFAKYPDVLLAIDYYQKGCKDVYVEHFNNRIKRRLIK